MCRRPPSCDIKPNECGVITLGRSSDQSPSALDASIDSHPTSSNDDVTILSVDSSVDSLPDPDPEPPPMAQLNVVDICPPIFTPSFDTDWDVLSDSSDDTPTTANTSSVRDISSLCHLPEKPIQFLGLGAPRLNTDLTSAAHAQIDTGAETTVTSLKYLLHHYRPFTPSNPPDLSLPLGAGYLL